MAIKVFGFEFGKEKPEDKAISSPVLDSSANVDVINQFGLMQTTLLSNDSNLLHKTLVLQNRTLAQQPEVDYAVDEVVNELADYSVQNPFKIEFIDFTAGAAAKKAIEEAFTKVSALYAVNLQDDLVQWYVDGSLARFIQLEQDNQGIRELKKVEPWMIKQYQPVSISVDPDTQATTYSEETPYYVYTQTDTGDLKGSSTGKKIKLPFDSICYVDTGKYDSNYNPISYVRKALKPINDMMSLENAAVIYRMTRAPEKRAFYVDTGQLPTQKAEEYIKTLMSRFKTKIDYDPKTGEVKTGNQNLIASTVDYWMPRRGGSASTEMSLISESGNPLNTIIDELQYFKKKAYQALKIPTNRIGGDSPSFSLGLSGTIDREEILFSQFIDRVQRQYLQGLYHLLMVELVTTGKMNKDEFDSIKSTIEVNMINNDFFAESKKLEMMTTRLNVIASLSEHIGTLFSQEYVFKEVLSMNDDEIAEMVKQIENPLIAPPATDG
jgi:hypothetical protein